MILHIAPDDKFTPFLQDVFEDAASGQNLWRIVRVKGNRSFAVIGDNSEIVANSYFSSLRLISDLRRVDCVILHSLFLSRRQKYLLFTVLPKGAPVIWRGWGFDYYRYIENVGLQITLPETNALQLNTELRGFVADCDLLLSKAKKIASGLLDNWLNKKVFARVNYFSCCVPDDFETLKRVVPEFRAEFLPLNYYSKEDTFLQGEGILDMSGPDILLGNSATKTNNHAEAIRILSRLDMEGRRVVVPLSYGDLNYQEAVIRLGKRLLGQSFVPLVDYLSLTEYGEIVAGCGLIVMNHVRQQAVGNISAALLRGGKVFLRPENPIYNYYTSLGVKLFKFSDDLTLGDLNSPLSSSDVLLNKETMSKIWARKQVLAQVQSISMLRREDL